MTTCSHLHSCSAGMEVGRRGAELADKKRKRKHMAASMDTKLDYWPWTDIIVV